jgi:hypothetical protein
MKKRAAVLSLAVILISCSILLLPLFPMPAVHGINNGGPQSHTPKYVSASCIVFGVGGLYWSDSYHISLSGCEA